MVTSASRHTGQLRRPATRIPTVCVVDPHAEDYGRWDKSADAHGVQLRIVASAEEALRFSRANAVDLWVINTELPKLSGYELCGMLKARSSRAAVYLVANEYSLEAERQALCHRATLFGCKASHFAWLDEWLLRRGFAPTPSPFSSILRAR